MVEVAEYESDYDEESLQLDYEEACNDVVDLQNELKAAQTEAAQLKLRLKAVAAQRPSNSCAVAPSMPSATATDPRLAELENFIMWLAQHAMLSEDTVLDVNLEVPIAGHAMHMGRVTQWPLAFPFGKRLYLSVPHEVAEQMRELLVNSKAQGKVSPESLQTVATFWTLVPGDLETITQKAAEPVVMLANKFSPVMTLVATWPTPGALEAFRALCSVDGEPFQLGQRVEIEYEGNWYVGTLHSLTATGKASVCCDVDGPSVLTVAPVYRVRRHGVPLARSRAVSDQGPQPVYVETEEENATSPKGAVAKQRGLQRSKSEGKLNAHTELRRCKSDSALNIS